MPFLSSTDNHYSQVVRKLQKIPRSASLKILEIGPGPKIIELYIPPNSVYHTMDNAELFWGTTYTYNHNLDKGAFPIQDDFYDIVICLETLEHVMYPERVMLEILRVAKKNALFFFSMPNEYNFIMRLYYLLGKKTKVDEPFQVVEKNLHIHKPRVNDILCFFSKHCKIVEVDYVWQSRASEHSSLARGLDKFLQVLSNIWPSMFARTIVVHGVRKKSS